MRMIKSTCDWLNIENYNTTSVLNYNGKIIEGDKILIGIGSSGLSRKWSTDNFINLIKKINIHKRYKIIILGGPNEKSQVEDIINNFSSIKITSLCNSSVYETFSYIKIENLCGYRLRFYAFKFCTQCENIWFIWRYTY